MKRLWSSSDLKKKIDLSGFAPKRDLKKTAFIWFCKEALQMSNRSSTGFEFRF